MGHAQSILCQVNHLRTLCSVLIQPIFNYAWHHTKTIPTQVSKGTFHFFIFFLFLFVYFIIFFIYIYILCILKKEYLEKSMLYLLVPVNEKYQNGQSKRSKFLLTCISYIITKSNNNNNNNNNNNKQANINVKSRRFGVIVTPFSRQSE